MMQFDALQRNEIHSNGSNDMELDFEPDLSVLMIFEIGIGKTVKVRRGPAAVTGNESRTMPLSEWMGRRGN